MTQIEPAKTIKEAVIQTMAFCGVQKLTKDNVKKVHLRSKQIQYLQNGPGFYVYDEQVEVPGEDGKSEKIVEQRSRMPYLSEFKDNIGAAHKDIQAIDDKQWNKIIVEHIVSKAKEWIEQEEAYLAAMKNQDNKDSEKYPY
jgi:hypothetical protein|tara:strand:+ start:436 stop:858 length:423 start_codon:yes stop_codon:yes gene_type:complete